MFPDYPFQSHFHTINSNRLHYIDEGEGPVIVMVHGNPTWSYYYRHVITLLKENFRVICPDHIGCGLSDKPQHYEYTLKQHMDNLESLLDHLQINRYSCMVHDWGGAIGMGVAGRHPDRIEKLVVLNTAAFHSRHIPFRIRICRWPFIGSLIVRGLNGFARPALTMAVTKPLDPDVARAFVAPYDSWKNRVAVHGFVRDIPLVPSDQSFQALTDVEYGLAKIAELKIPMLICWGGKDFCFNDHFYNEWCRRFPDAEKLYLAQANHYVLEDGFDKIKPVLLDFMATSTETENNQ